MADYMVRYQPMLTSSIDYQICFTHTYIGVEDEWLRYDPKAPRQEELWIGGSPVRLHFDMLWEAFKPRPEYLNMIERSKAPEWAVAATILTLECLDEALRAEIFSARWHLVPVENWIQHLKSQLDLPSRAMIFGTYRGSGVALLRNLMNVTARADEQADWAKELSERDTYHAMKCVWDEPELPYSAWFTTLENLTLELAREHIPRMGRDRRVEDLEEWWQSRHHATPSGSSSERKGVQDSLLADPLFNPTDRPSKKAVVEALPDDHMFTLLNSNPETHARCSTKREPGLKNRPIHANNDSSFFIESYSLVHAEKEMDDVLGCYAKMAPADVLSWLDSAQQTWNYGGTWVSLDYPNYCTFHAKWELAVASRARAIAWSEAEQPDRIKNAKSLCALWIALGHYNSTLRLEAQDKFFLNVNGLYSGQRATILDHDYMHRPNARAAMLLCRRLKWTCDPERSWYTGDDEDAWFRELVAALGYVTAHALCGNRFQARKQLSGRVNRYRKAGRYLRLGEDIIDLDSCTHSYLQRDSSNDNLPIRPLARIIATLASGNWYAEPGIWYDSAITSTSDNFWECVTRGMPLDIAQRLAGAFLDRLMIVRPTLKEDVPAYKLEWWSFANSADHPLWRGTSAGKRKCPIMVTRPNPHSCWPSKATDAWMDRVKNILEGLRPQRIEQYRNYLLRETVGGSYHHYRMRAMRDAARAYWPERSSVIVYETRQLPSPPPVAMLLRHYRGTPSRRRPVSEDELLARLGIDQYLFNLVGATKNLYARLKPQDWARWSLLTTKYKVNESLELTDGSIQSWASNLGAYIPELHCQTTEPVLNTFICVYAGNGAGKTYFADRFAGICDMDVPVYAEIGWRTRAKRYTRADERDTDEPRVTIRWAQRHQLKVIVTQWPVDLMNRAAELLDVKLQWMVLDPGRDTREKRLLERGYDSDLVFELVNYADEQISHIPDAPVYAEAGALAMACGII